MQRPRRKQLPMGRARRNNNDVIDGLILRVTLHLPEQFASTSASFNFQHYVTTPFRASSSNRPNGQFNELWQCPCQYVFSCVVIPVQNSSTITAMNPNAQGFLDYLSTTRALLACVLCVDTYHSTASTLSLARQDLDEAIPASVQDTTRQSAVLDHPLNVQALQSNDAVPINQRTTNFVVHVLAGMPHFGVQFGHTLLDFLAPG